MQAVGDGGGGGGGRRRRTSAKKVKYVEEEDSEAEELEKVEKRRKARQLDHESRAVAGYPLLDQIVGRRINTRSGATEYLCKFVGRSYLHLWWLTFEELELFIPEGYQKQHRVQLYDRKLKKDGYQDLDDVDDLEANKVTVEKILNHKVDPLDKLDEQIEKRRKEIVVPSHFPRITSYFLLDKAEGLQERMTGIVRKLGNEHGGEIFQQPVDPEEVPDYLNIITNPMDLGTIGARLARESYYIGPSALELFASDVRLVFANCKEFNSEDSDIWKLANDLSKCFEKWLYDWILCPSAWLKLPPTGCLEEDRSLAEDSFDSWLAWETGCSTCRHNSDNDQLLLCDRCDGEIHMFCHKPQIKNLPEGEWFCSFCTVRNKYEAESAAKREELLQAPEEKFNRKVSGRDGAEKKQPKAEKLPTANDRATFFLVKWVGVSVRYSTWERAEDIGDDEQIQRYFKFSRVPTAKEIMESSCQLPCCAKRIQLFSNEASRKNCEKDRFCTLGWQHEGDCSREIKTLEKAYGSREYQKLRMVEQVKAQLFAFHCLLNNHTPDKEVLKQCGMFTNAFVCKKQYLVAKVLQEDGGDEDYSEDEEASESSDDDDDFDMDDLPGPEPSNDDDEEEEDGSTKKNADEEVAEVLGSMVEHVALGYPVVQEPFSQKLKYNSVFPRTATLAVPRFTEFCVPLRRSPLGLGMRLGVNDDGSASVLGFQPLPGPGHIIGPAEASRVISPGDILAAVNGVPVAGREFREIINLISQSPEIVVFHFHTSRPAYIYPPVCQPRSVTLQREQSRDDAAEPSPFIPFSYNKFKPMLKVGTSSHVALPVQPELSNYVAPSGPMQHLYAGIVDNSIDPHEHFASFLPNKAMKRSNADKKDEKNEFVPYEQSPTYKGGRTLRAYQVEGLNWMISCFKAQRSCILADEMGLGKTVQVVSVVDHLKTEENIRGPFLIVVPLSTIGHWRREIESWTDLNVCVYHDVGDKGSKFTAKDMRAVIRDQEWYYPGLGNSVFKFHILLTTFETILADFEELEHIHWRLLVVDEAHRLKSAGSRVLKQMRVLHCDRKLLLTGTPLQNNTQELWVLLNFLEPVKFDNMEEFNTNFGKLHSQEQVLQLQKLMTPYILRRVKEDVEKSIPPKEETIIAVELTTLQKQYYRAIYDKNKSFLYRGTKNGLPTLNNIQLQLRKCCNHPFLIKGVEDRELEELGERPNQAKVMEKTIQCSGKFVLVSKLLPKLRNEGRKVLIFSQFLKQLDLLERYCDFNGFGYERLDGSTGGSARQSAIDRFSRPSSKTFVFLLSTKAGGVGINLIAADTVIIFDSDWNPQNDLQAQARCHRIGQKKSVQIYRLVTRNTYESEMFDRASRKLGLEQAILGTASFNDSMGPADKPSAEQLVELLKRGAYALMEDDDNASKQFEERDIETILKENARQRKLLAKNRKRKSLGGMSVDRSMFVAEGSTGDIAVDDPNFWEKVLPGAVSVEMLSLKLEDGSALTTRQAKIKFINNLDIALNDLVTEMKNGGEEDSRFGSNLEHEYDIAIQVLHLVSTKHKKEFSSDQLDLVKSYLNKLEKSRVRSCRITTAKKEEVQFDAPASAKKRRKTKPGNRAPVREVINDSDDLCTLCGDGGLILLCDGPCHRSFHLECVGIKDEPDGEHWLCPDCEAGRHMCLICKQVGEMGAEFGVIQCSMAKCGRFYHSGCLSKHPRVEWVGKKRFRCPSHYCHGCSQKKNAKRVTVVSCIHCSQSFHPKCIKSTEQYIRLSNNLMICASHLQGGKKAFANPLAHKAASGSNGQAANGNAVKEEAHPEAAHKVEKVCALCRQGDTASKADGKNKDAAATSIEGPFLDAPVRLQYPDKPGETVYVHMNCALHSPEVYVKSNGSFCNLTRAIKRGRQLKCSKCKVNGATVGCVVEKCRCNFHLRCAVENGGEFIGSPYTLYCKAHAAQKNAEPKLMCLCHTQDQEDSGLSLECGSCSIKFHPKCVNMSERQAAKKSKTLWLCPNCSDVKTVSMKYLNDASAPINE
ncbi:TPA: hypothetical protein N0F65_011625 [Lagenidium giganteum]|uniref:Chromodomain-helicase-DNA-binding protein 9 n=1 Tax=Lagenidium giganteum TaxID=4803 RepID=A0AAV2Z7C9_9STRA|nr:TPA: hypothetical protein N0F65_011625 [Lagenidium giganteum]